MAFESDLKVGVVLSTEQGCFRNVLRGVHKFSLARRGWIVELISPRDDLLPLLRREDITALVLGPTQDVADARAAIEQVRGWAVGVAGEYGDDADFAKLPWIDSDDVAVGRLAARHFCERDFEHFAFVGTHAGWSDRRLHGFSAELRAQGVPPPIIYISDDMQAGKFWPLPNYGLEVAEWLEALPRPLALFAANDLRGRELTKICRSRRIAVPDDVAILGCDNDDLACELSYPPLSSIAIAWQVLGHEAAATLDRMLARGKPGTGGDVPRQRLLSPGGVEVRQSTDIAATADVDVAAATRFIRTNAHRPINVTDVLTAVPVGRRSLEKRFREVLGRSPLEEIRRAHVERAKHLLTQTALPMPRVAADSGFASASWFSKAFRDLTGESPTAFRRRTRVR